jgi:hypothetical protein
MPGKTLKRSKVKIQTAVNGDNLAGRLRKSKSGYLGFMATGCGVFMKITTDRIDLSGYCRYSWIKGGI